MANKTYRGLAFTTTRAAANFKKMSADLSGMLTFNRTRKGLSQKHLADALGWTQPRISQLENGYHNFTLKQLCELAEALGCSVSISIKDQ
jgi:transcriptional regulator with XRE-family HTH domain